MNKGRYYSYQMLCGIEALNSGQVYAELMHFIIYMASREKFETFIKSKAADTNAGQTVDIYDNAEISDQSLGKGVSLKTHIKALSAITETVSFCGEEGDPIEISSHSFIVPSTAVYEDLIARQRPVNVTVFANPNRYFLMSGEA